VVSPNSNLAPGTVVLARAVINASSGVGWNCIVNTGAVIEHDCQISDHVHISPSATLGGNVTVDAFAHAGTGASVLPGLRIGKGATIGAGAVVLTAIPAKVTAVGVPARILRKECEDAAAADQPKANRRILLSVPHMGGHEKQFVEEAFASNWLSTVGPNIDAFEEEFGAQLGASAVAVGSGTAAIHLGLRALGVAPGDTVFCSDLTFVASVNPVQYLGATPVFIDSERTSWNMDPRQLAAALRDAASRNSLPKAVIVVHLFGQCADMDPILEACAQYRVPVLEDAAETLGALYKGRPAGTLGDIAAFSFNGNKIITTTGGGMLVSKNQDLVAKARFWATQSRDPGLAYNHSELGYNYRLSNVLAGIGRGQLRVLNERVEQRRAIALRYAHAFSGVPGMTLMPQSSYGLHTNWLSCFLINEPEFGCSRDALISSLDRAGIESRPVWKPMHMQALYASAEVYGGDVAEDLFRRGICLPSSSSLSGDDQNYVIQQVKRIASESSGQHLASQLFPTTSEEYFEVRPT
jgi:pyridoxal phosphate-dependent aminotransferase EpsN